jgi:hypothetical protein
MNDLNDKERRFIYVMLMIIAAMFAFAVYHMLLGSG